MLAESHQNFTIMGPAPDYPRSDEPVSRELMEEIRAFFDAADPGSFKTAFFNILLAYGGHYHYNAGEPVEVVETLDRLERLLAGVKAWAGGAAAPQAVGGDSEGPAARPRSGGAPGHARVSPVNVLARFFEDGRYLNVEGTLRSVRFFSLCRQSGMEDGAAIDTLKFYHDITTLVEACDSIRKASFDR